MPGAKCEELFQELLEQVIKEMDDKTGEIKYDLISDSELISTNVTLNLSFSSLGIFNREIITNHCFVKECLVKQAILQKEK